MTAVIHHGPPGSYKSFAIVQDIVIPALMKGRTVVTNIRGLDDIDRIAQAMDVEIPDGTQLIHVGQRSKEDYEKMATFHHWVPVGALICIDEAQAVYPTRLRSLSVFDVPEGQERENYNGEAMPVDVERAFDMHRHFNWDIYISTPNIAKIHKEIRGVCEYAYRHRDMSGLLPWIKNQWREFKHDSEQSGKSVSHYIGSPVVKKADLRVFECYRSTATGEAKSSNENKNIFNDPKLRVFLSVAVFALCVFIYALWGAVERYSDRINQNTEASVTPSAAAPAVVTTPDNSSQVDSFPAEVSDRLTVPLSSLLSGRELFFAGSFFGRHYFTALGDKSQLTFTDIDFESAGFSVDVLSDCLAILRSPESVTYATCLPDIDDQKDRSVAASDAPERIF